MADDAVVVHALGRVRRFRGGQLARAVPRIESLVVGQDGTSLGAFLAQELVTAELLLAAVLIKRAADQIDNIVHAVGMLVCLHEILEGGERIAAVSLDAGNTGKPFDLVTDRRIAEFTFIDWKGGSESIRTQKLSRISTNSLKQARPSDGTCTSWATKHAPKVFTSTTSCKDMLQKYAPLRDTFLQRYHATVTVREYYDAKKHLISLENLEVAAPMAATAFGAAGAADA